VQKARGEITMMDANFYDAQGFCVLMTAADTVKEIMDFGLEYPTWRTVIITKPYTDAKLPRLVKIKTRTLAQQRSAVTRYRRMLSKTAQHLLMTSSRKKK
jgi:hypothetical protein